MRVRRVLSISSTIEQLEGRALPSAVTPLQGFECNRTFGQFRVGSRCRFDNGRVSTGQSFDHAD